MYYLDKMEKNNEKFLRNCKGSHVGMMLSFAIFVTFIIFLYSVFQPSIGIGANKDIMIDDIKAKITENISSNFTSASVVIAEDSNPNSTCVTLTNFLGFLAVNPPYKVIVKNEKLEDQEVYIIDQTSPDLKINRQSTSNTFFKAYSSPEFAPLGTESVGSCTSTSDYSIGSVVSGEYIFEKKMNEIINNYNTDYEGLKKKLKIVSNTEFSFGFTTTNGTVIETKQDIISANVYAEEIPIQYIDNEANIRSGFIKIKVW